MGSMHINIPSISGRAFLLVSGEGPALVLFNGIGTPAAIWAPLMARIDGYRLHAIDLPGYGLTDTTPGFTDHLRSSAVSYLEDVYRSLELEQAAFIANSMGSLWTSWLALDRPKRIKALLHIGCPVIILNTSAPLQMRLLSIKILGRLLTYIQPPSRKQVKELSKMVNQHPMVPELISLLLATEQMPHFFPMFLSTLNSLIKLTDHPNSARGG